MLVGIVSPLGGLAGFGLPGSGFGVGVGKVEPLPYRYMFRRLGPGDESQQSIQDSCNCI